MLTIAKMGAHSVAYYQSTVDENRGPDSYYSEDGKQPASVWLRGEKLSEVYLGPYVGGGIEIWFAYVLALVFLLFRPQGLFGEKIIDRV